MSFGNLLATGFGKLVFRHNNYLSRGGGGSSPAARKARL